jgi:hypothetical protein
LQNEFNKEKVAGGNRILVGFIFPIGLMGFLGFIGLMGWDL